MLKYLIVLASFVCLISLKTSFSATYPWGNSRNFTALSPACEQIGHESLSSYEADEESERKAITLMCLGNGDGKCLSTLLLSLSSYSYDELNELKPIAESCRGSNPECVSWIKNNINSQLSNEREEAIEIGKACYAVNMACLLDKCSREFFGHCEQNFEKLKEFARRCSSF